MLQSASPVVHAVRPAAGTAQRVAFTEGARDGVIALDFDVSAGTGVERAGDNLIFSFEDGGTLAIDAFFVTNGKDLPSFRLSDGTIIDGKTLLSSLNADLDLTASGSTSGGGGNYDDNAGSLLGGLDTLGKGRGTGDWSRGVAEGETAQSEPALEEPNEQPVAQDAESQAKEDEAHPGGQLIVYDANGGSHIFTPADSKLLYTDSRGVLHAVSAEDAGFVLNPDGSWSLDTSMDLYQDLSEGADAVLVVRYHVTDDSGADNGVSNDATLTIRFKGTNDAPKWEASIVNAEASEAALETSLGYILSGDLNASDIDALDRLTYSADTGSAASDNGDRPGGYTTDTFGTFRVDPATGAWTFKAESQEQKEAIDSLADGETLTLTYPVHADDGHGGVIDETVTITITGTNDTPKWESSSKTDASATEVELEGTLNYTLSGALAAGDVDVGGSANLQYSFSAGTAESDNGGRPVGYTADTFGAFSVDPDTGEWTFTAASQEQKDAVNSLAAGETLTLAYPVHATDDIGGVTNATVTITITGSNDAPVWKAVTEAFTVTENTLENAASYSLSGNLLAEDADIGDTLSYSVINSTADSDNAERLDIAAADFGSLSFEEGKWTFAADSDEQKSAVNSLREGEVLTLRYTVQASDGKGGSTPEQTVTIKITGSNDRPVVEDAGRELYEDTVYSGDLTEALTDVDAGDTHTYALAEAAVTYTDAQGEIHTVSADEAGFVLGSDGTWTLDTTKPLYQSLDAGSTGILVVAYQATDNSGADNATSEKAKLTVTIGGRNDQPVVKNATDSAAEDQTHPGGSLAALVSDADTADTHTFAVSGTTVSYTDAQSVLHTVSAADAGFELGSDGDWTLDTTKTLYQDLRAGATGTLKVNYTATDSSGAQDGSATSAPKTLTVTITGADDGAHVTGGDVTLDEPDDVSWWSGSGAGVTPTDPDALSGKSSVVDLSFSDIDKGDIINASINASISAPSGSSISFTTDNAGNILAFDGDAHIDGAWGRLAYDTDGGKWVYTTFNRADQLNPNELDPSDPSRDPDTGDGLDAFGITVTGSGNGETKELTVRVSAHDDAPDVFAGRPVTHDQPSQVLGPYLDEGNSSTELSGVLNLVDVDSDDKDLTFYFKDQHGEYVKGALSGTDDAPVWTFDVQYGTVALTWDPTASDALIGVTGNEAGAWRYAYVFDTAAETQKNTALTDHIGIRAANPEYSGSNVDGAYDPADANSYVELNIPVNIVTTDYGTGNPRPVFDVLHFGTDAQGDELVTFNANPATNHDSVLDNDRTIDKQDAARWNAETESWEFAPGVSVEVGAGNVAGYGSWSLDAEGRFSFIPDWSSPALKALPAGQTASLPLFYTMIEGNARFSSYVIVEIEGRNDAPEAQNIRLNLTPGWTSPGELHDILSLAASDADRGDVTHFEFYDKEGTPLSAVPGNAAVHAFDGSDLPPGFVFDPDGDGNNGFTEQVSGEAVIRGEHGWLVRNASGTWDYVVDRADPDYLALKKGETLTETFGFKAVDQSGAASDLKELTIRIDGSWQKMAVHDLDSTLGLYPMHFTSGGDAWSIGLDRGSDIQEDGTLNAGNLSASTQEMRAMASDDTATYYVCSNLDNLVQSLQTGAGGVTPTYSYSLSATGNIGSAPLYGRDADTGAIVRIGTVGIMHTRILYIFFNDHTETKYSLQGEFTEFFTDANGNNPLRLYVTSSLGPETKTPLDIDFTLSFADDSPVVRGARLSLGDEDSASGAVRFHDVDTAEDKLSLWVEDPAGTDKLLKVEADGTTLIYSRGDQPIGTLTVNKDGTFTYTRANPADTENHNIRVVVSDGNSATESLITIDNADATGTAILKPDSFRVPLSEHGLWSSDRSGTSVDLLKNDTGTTGEVLNAGVYFLDKHVVAVQDQSGVEGPRWGIDLEGAGLSPYLYLAGEYAERFEIKLSELSITVRSNGMVSVDGSQNMTVYDKVTGNSYSFSAHSIHQVKDRMLGDINADLAEKGESPITETQLADALKLHFTYQVKEAGSGELREGDFVLDYWVPGNTSQYYDTLHVTQTATSDIRAGTVFDRAQEQDEDTGFLRATTRTGSVTVVFDTTGDDIAVRFGTFDAAGKATAGGASDWIDLRTHMEGAGGAFAAAIPLYAWINTTTGQVGTADGGNGWVCVQVGEGIFTQTGSPSSTQVGTDADGNPDYAYTYDRMRGYMDIRFLTPEGEHEAALQVYMDAVKNLGEGQAANMLFYHAKSQDKYGAQTAATVLVSLAGSDVVLGDNNLPMAVAVNEDALLAGGQVIDLLSGARHTYVNGMDSGGRTDAGGWIGLEFGDRDPTPGVVDASPTVVYGRYGMLTLAAGAVGKYTYTAYDPADENLTDAQRAAGVTVRGLTNGQTLTETFDFIAYDKNLESDGGGLVITIKGKSDGFTVSLPGGADGGASVAVTEGDVLNVQLSSLITTQDAGDIRYYIQYTDPDTNNIVDTHEKPSGEGVELVETIYGRLLFTPDLGNYVFEPNGNLQEGEQKHLEIKVRAVLTTEGEEQDTGWRDYGIEITGVNDAPVMQPENIFLAFPDNNVPGALAWTDIDNNPSEQAGLFRLDARSEASVDAGSTTEGLETVHGVYGDLILNVNQGTFTYDLKENAFTGGTHRVVDEFQVKVTDPGSDKQGADARESGEASLFVYGVDGGFLQSDDDTITLPDAGKAYIIHGGAGDDTIDLGDGSTGQNILVWKSGDEGSETLPAIDTILHFSKGLEGDALDLHDLLDGLKAADVGDSAKDMISFKVEDGNTTINIGAADEPGRQVQQIVLSNVQLETSNGTGYDQLAHQILLITS